MIGDVALFVFSLFDVGSLLFLTVYVWIIPEIAFQGLITLLLLIEWHWILFFVNMPMTCWQIYKKLTVPSGNFGIYDPTEIHNRGNLKKHMRDSMIRLAFYLIFFFVYLYCMIIALLTKAPSSSGISEEF